VFLVASIAVAQDAPRTLAERTNYQETSSHADVMGFCADLAKRSPLVKFTDFGTSTEGKKLPLLILSDPPVATPEEAKKLGKPVVMTFANIHAGEVDGKEAVLMLARDLVEKKSDLLKTFVILIAPNFNPDGNDKFADSGINRRGQNGPAKTGTRANGQNMDLNRDFVKVETPEVKALLHVMNTWDPLVVIDCHTTNGSYHRYTLTYDTPRYVAVDPKLVAFGQDQLLPATTKKVKAATGFDTFQYGNFGAGQTRWEPSGYPGNPRFGIQYIGVRGRIGILSESYSYASFEDRVKASYAFVKACFEFAAENLDAVKAVAAAAAAPRETVGLRSKHVAAGDPVKVLGYESTRRENGKVVLGPPKDFTIPVMTKMEPTLSVTRPAIYLIEPKYAKAVEALKAHGIAVETVTEDATVPAESYRVKKTTVARSPFQGHRTVDQVDVEKIELQFAAKPGTFVVRTNQPLGNLAVYLLEPQAEDGLATWNYFDDGLDADAIFPVRRVVKDVALKTEKLKNGPKLAGIKRLTAGDTTGPE
jgi:murein tripeptide amidase MpaA